jgi:hypothetical protein
MKIAVFHTMPNSSSFGATNTKFVAEAFMSGIIQCGHTALLQPLSESIDDCDAIAFYGMCPDHVQLAKKMSAQNKPFIIIDAPYFDRQPRGRGHLKVSVNNLHPHNYFQKVKHPSDRFIHHKLEVKPMRKGGNFILLAGIGMKSSDYYNIPFQSWDKVMASEIRKYTRMPIVYRPKPGRSSQVSDKIPDTIWSKPSDGSRTIRDKDLRTTIDKSFAVVSHHSNVAVDGILCGVPCFVVDGVGLAIGLSDISQIKFPRIVSIDEQMQFLYDLAYTQWTLAEMADGKCWRYLESDNLLIGTKL